MDRPRHHRAQRAYPRTARVNALLQEILAEQLERLADADESLRLLTLTAVLCDPDLRHAKALFASLSEEGAASLEEHRKALQGAIAAQARLRRTPLLAFEPDPMLAAAQRIEEALRRAASQAAATDEVPGPDDSPDEAADGEPDGPVVGPTSDGADAGRARP